MITFLVFDDDFMPSVRTSMIFFCFTRENSGNLQASHDFFFFALKIDNLRYIFFFFEGNARRDWRSWVPRTEGNFYLYIYRVQYTIKLS